MSEAQPSNGNVFEYHTLRAFIGLIAVSIPTVVTVFSGESLNSISAYYHSDSRDLFVGMLCIVGAFLLAYNGHTPTQLRLSKVAAFAAVAIALFPTTKEGCEPDFVSRVHLISAGTLFAILAYFCRVFYFRAKDKKDKGKVWRQIVYTVSGVTIVLSLLVAVVVALVLPDELKDSRVIYVAESAALVAFGIAWFTAGAYQIANELRARMGV